MIVDEGQRLKNTRGKLNESLAALKYGEATRPPPLRGVKRKLVLSGRETDGGYELAKHWIMIY